MESNTYFTYWIKRYGKEDFKNLTDKVIQNVAIPLDYQKGNKK